MRLDSVRLSVALVTLPLMAFALRQGEHVRDGGWRILALVMFIIFWGAVVGLAVWAFSRIAGSRKAERSPMDIAKERLAKGEISSDEFERIKQQLS
jgi:putative membrane protein